MSLNAGGFQLIQRLSATLPPAVAYSWADCIADLYAWRVPKEREAVAHNLAWLTGQPMAAEASSVREVFRHFGRYLIEFFSAHRPSPPSIIVEGSDHLSNAYRRGQGVILLTAHLGNWEVGGIAVHRLGFPVTAIARPHQDPVVNRLFNDQRARCGIEVIPLGAEMVQRSLHCLRQGRCLGVLGDRVFQGEGLSIACLGRSLRLPPGPAVLSLRAQAPVVPTFLIREGLWRFRLCIEPAIWPTDGWHGGQAMAQLTSQYANIFAAYWRRFPMQWMIFEPV